MLSFSFKDSSTGAPCLHHNPAVLHEGKRHSFGAGLVLQITHDLKLCTLYLRVAVFGVFILKLPFRIRGTYNGYTV